MRVLLAEPNAQLASVFARSILEHGIDVIVEITAAAALERATTEHLDVIVWNSVLRLRPEWNPSTLLAARGARAPLVLLTGSSDDGSAPVTDSRGTIRLCEPFATRDLVRAIRRASEMPRPAPVKPVTIADLEIDLTDARAKRAGTSLQLTAKEFELLRCLASSPGAWIERDVLESSIWGPETPGHPNRLDVLVRRLRRRVDDSHARKLIGTRRGSGYRIAE